MAGGYDEPRNEWQFSHEYPDGRRPGTLVSETLTLRESGLCRWSRLLNTKDAKGVRGQGECWHRGSVKSIRFSAKVGDPSREFSMFGERQEVRRRAIILWFWAKAPVLTGWICLLCNPLTQMLLLSGFVPLALYHVYPKDSARYLMSGAAHPEGFRWAGAISFFLILLGIATSWWLRTVGKPPSSDEPEPPASFRPRFKSVDRLYAQNAMNGTLVGLLITWYVFILVAAPLMEPAGRENPKCNMQGCEDAFGQLVGTCGVGSCSCGTDYDISCTRASALYPPQMCRTEDAPICANDTTKASGVHIPLLVASVGSVIATGVLFLLWLVNHATIAMSWSEASSHAVSAVKPRPMPYHRIAITFEAEQQGSLVCTVGGQEDLNVLASLLMPEAPVSSDFSGLDFAPSYAPPAMNLPMDPLTGLSTGLSNWPSDLDDLQWGEEDLEYATEYTTDEPPDLQWD
eukprot:CAMPEP_0197654664 /NCGR_PEP_ID=MMETSP1338-20131121/38985_1 /TAXON_ID=43686 ORGANISM="Pelagodinium beii, Strain RCC1491" /NCGR_SAMPLE_ID=MMETSP1338 /ASSEMBLY_ACC=CAM_ASM_000754 /LENGTH=457 /DNA_ID=CAMNT_0043230153 /DNA_START=90 /DNA_END=1463 /DNA_ORIENTATION=-